MNGRKRVIAKGITVLMLLTALALAGCGGSQPASDESASVKKADSKIREDKFTRDGTGTASDTKEEKDSQAATSESRTGEKSSGSMAAASGDSGGVVGGMIEIRKPWVRIRSAPNNDASPIGVAYGNDTFDVLEQEGEWVQVRLNKNQLGWVPVSATRE